MDVLRPQLIRIGNRWYRKNPLASREGSNPEDEIEPDFDMMGDCYEDEICDAGLDIEEFSGGFRVRLNYPSVFFKYIIGKRGETKRRLETETRTQIKIPKAGQEGEIVIQGHDRKGVVSAKTRVDVLVDSARQKQPFTHFLSVPVQSEEIIEKFEDFKFAIMDDDARDSGVDATIFQNPQKLHMTIGTLVLLSEAEIQRAKEVLVQCHDDLVEPILNSNPLYIDVRGLEYMNDDPGAVDVLYAKLVPGPEADKLQMLVDRLVDRFLSLHLMQRQFERVKLHITVMNTLFRKDPSGASAPRLQGMRAAPRDRESFNAASILKRFEQFEFGPLPVDRVELSQRYSTGPDGYYQSSGSLKLL
ncbi:activating signal cointegrator 1 complex subunit 1-like [Babylonia areolata]|uniref:activating signal cointegrator 1 complex subunit 1-like n=1 Tax=Babylonia areolata TaxID=304850 RepID=UPI003FD4C143